MVNIIVIGAGPGGVAAALRAARLGATVTLVEKDLIGGTCLNRGCISMATMAASVTLLEAIKGAVDSGIIVQGVSLDYPKLLARCNTIMEGLRLATEGLLAGEGVKVVQGTAHFLNPGEIEVSGPGGTQRLQADKIIIAAGATLVKPAIPGLASSEISDPTGLFSLPSPPASLVISGGGMIEVQLGSLLQGLGSAVTIVEEGGQLLPEEDQEVGARLRESLKDRGIQILLHSHIKGVRKDAQGLVVTIATRKGEQTIVASHILAGTRLPAIAGLDLERAGVIVRDGRIIVNERLETTQPGIFAVGDVVGPPMLSHLATAGGIVAAENALGRDVRWRPKAVPRCLYTIPEVACVGLTEAQAEAQGYQVTTTMIPFSLSARAATLGQTEGSLKIVSEGKYGQILGVHIVGPRATDLIGEACLAMEMEATVDYLARAIRAHPTLSETLVEAARDLRGEALFVPR